MGVEVGKELGNRKMCENTRARCVRSRASQEFSLNISKRHDGKQRENGYQNLEQWSQMR